MQAEVGWCWRSSWDPRGNCGGGGNSGLGIALGREFRLLAALGVTERSGAIRRPWSNTKLGLTRNKCFRGKLTNGFVIVEPTQGFNGALFLGDRPYDLRRSIPTYLLACSNLGLSRDCDRVCLIPNLFSLFVRRFATTPDGNGSVLVYPRSFRHC